MAGAAVGEFQALGVVHGDAPAVGVGGLAADDRPQSFPEVRRGFALAPALDADGREGDAQRPDARAVARLVDAGVHQRFGTFVHARKATEGRRQ